VSPYRIASAVLLSGCGPAVGMVEDATGTAATTGMPTSTSGASTSTDAAADTYDSHWFIMDPDGCHHCGHECDVWAQDCERGYRCMPWANDGGDRWNATLCTEIDPTPAAVGEPCHAVESAFSGADDCMFGSVCWGVDPVTLEGTCVAICEGSEADRRCGEGLECFIGFEGVITLCLPSCDPFDPLCGEGEVCSGDANGFVSDEPFVCLPTPPFTPRSYGEPCGGLEICAAGLACVRAPNVPGCEDHCCTMLGDLAQGPICPDPAQTCIPVDDTMPESGLCYCGVPA